MADALLIAILLVSFGLAIGFVQVLDRMVERGADPDSLADEPPDTGAAPSPGLDGRAGGLR